MLQSRSSEEDEEGKITAGGEVSAMARKAKKTRRGKALRPTGQGYRLEHRKSGRRFVATLIGTHIVQGIKIALLVVR